MQISDLLIQYQQNLSTGSDVSVSPKGVEQLVETAKQLQVGSIFEGTVNNIKGNQILLGLSSGQNITARLDANISLVKGQSVFFQVKSNEDNTIQIKPVSLGGGSGNPTLSMALEAAALPVNERNLNMVNTMMQEQMPIDAKSLQEMSKSLVQVPQAMPQTIVEMNKLGLPISETMVTQFENYQEGKAQILPELASLSSAITSLVTSEETNIAEVVSFQNEVANILLGEETSDTQVAQNPTTSEQNVASLGADVANDTVVLSEAETETTEDTLSLLSRQTQVFSQTLLPAEEYAPETLGKTVRAEEFVSLQKSFSSIPEFVKDNPELFTENGQLRPEADAKTLVAKLTTYLGEAVSSGQVTQTQAKHILSEKGWASTFDAVLKDAFSLKPEEITEEHVVSKLYEKINEKTQQMLEAATQTLSKGAESVSAQSKGIQQNIEFMHEVNQMYSFVQIPIHLMDQNTNADLYVYRNKRQNYSEDDPLTAFLHFDMQHLGPVDISVKMFQKDVSMNWFFDNDEIVDFMSANVHLLSERLEEKGYHCDMNVKSQEKEMDFVADFLKSEEKPIGEVHRYSFDVRA